MPNIGYALNIQMGEEVIIICKCHIKIAVKVIIIDVMAFIINLIAIIIDVMAIIVQSMEASKDGKRRAVMEKDKLITEGMEKVSSRQCSEWEEEILVLNEEIEDTQRGISAFRSRMDSLAGIVKQAVFEDVGELNESECAADLAGKLVHEAGACYALEDEIHQCVKELDVRIKRPNSTSTPLNYLLQMPPLKTEDQIADSKKYIHLLSDQLTPKTNCEMRLQLLLLKQRKRQLTVLCRQLVSFSLEVQDSPESREVLDKLMSLDFSCLHSSGSLEQEFRCSVCVCVCVCVCAHVCVVLCVCVCTCVCVVHLCVCVIVKC